MMRWWLVVTGLILGSISVRAQVWLPPPAGYAVMGPGWSFGCYSAPLPYTVSSWWLGPGWSYSHQIILQPPRGVRPPKRPKNELPPNSPPVDGPSDVPSDGSVSDRQFRQAVERGEFLVIQPGLLKLGDVEVAPPARVPRVVLEDEQPPAEPTARAVFHVKQAQAAFRERWYGTATEQLEAATRADSAQPLPWFLLAQARMARGHYREAVLAIQAGMKLAPDWPATPFKIGELYGNDAKHFAEHLGKLRAAQKVHAEDPLLAFLLGYQLWFTGEREEAMKLLRQASSVVQDNGMIERFLQQAEG